jgi:hypothetical protein
VREGVSARAEAGTGPAEVLEGWAGRGTGGGGGSNIVCSGRMIVLGAVVPTFMQRLIISKTRERCGEDEESKEGGGEGGGGGVGQRRDKGREARVWREVGWGGDLKFLTGFVKIRCFCYNLRLRMQSNRVSINAFVKSYMHFYSDARYDCRVQSLRRPDAAEKGNNVALIVDHGPFEGSSAIAASERVTLIQ